jgi:hypothetical protein
LLNTAGTAAITVTDPVSQVSSTSKNFTIASGPSINTNGLSPSSVAAGGSTAVSLVINGANFLSTDVVSWTPPSSGTSTPAAILIATLPTGTTTPTPGTSYINSVGSGGTTITLNIDPSLLTTVGNVQIQVLDNVDNAKSNIETLAISGPAVNSITPSGTTAGIASATTITVNGSNFISGTSVVTWCNSCGTSPISLSTTFVSSGQLTASIPASLVTASGTAQIGVSNGTVAATATQNFTIGNVALTSVSTSQASAGTPGLALTLTGSNFTSSSIVLFSLGATATSLTPTFVNSTELQVFIPAAQLTSEGSATISVQVGSSVSNTVPFSVLGPTITTISPSNSAAGVTTSFPLAITGTNFISGSIVEWNNGTSSTPLNTSFQDAGDLVAIVTPTQLATAGTAIISVQNTTSAVSAGVVFSVGAAPTIKTDGTGLSVLTLPAGSASQQITINGTNYTTSSTVTWNNNGTTTTLSSGFISSTQLTATLTSALLANAGSALVTVANGTVLSNPVAFTITAGTVPTITSVSPASAMAGGAAFPLIVIGTNFVSGSSIQWNNGGTVTSLAASVSGGQLNALVPATLIATAATVYISVLNPGGGTSSSLPFTISSNLPTITALSQTTAMVGSSAIQLTVTGTNFVSGSTVDWNAGSSAVGLQTIYNNSGSLTAIVPAADLSTVGTVLVTVVNPGSGTAAGPTSSAALFSVTPAGAPIINTTNGIAPSSAVVGSTSFSITLNGSNFFSGSTVQWTVGSTVTQLTTSYLSANELSAVVTTTLVSTAGTAFISVTNPGGSVSNLVSFTVGSAPGPTISSLTPSSATSGGAAYQLVVSGTNFATGSVVQWNSGSGATSLATIVLSSTQLSALVPANLIATPGTAFIDVLNTGSVASNVEAYTISAGAAPTINSSNGLSPATATVGTSSVQLFVSGTNFISTSVVQWSTGSTPAALSTVYISSTQLSAIIPTSDLASAGTAFVNVSNGSGNVSNSVPFTVAAQGSPTISTTNGLIPASASAGGAAFQLVVIGTNFVSGSTVYWNAGTPQALTTSYVSSTQLTAVVTAALIASSGTAFVSVQNAGTPVVNSNSVAFTIGASTSLPTINSSGGLLPAQAAAGSATFQLTVTGTNFENGAVVEWNANGTAQALTTGFGNSTTLTALVPATLVASPGIALISVTNADKNISNSVTFSISGSVPVLTQLAPATAAAGTQGLLLVLTGTGFASGSTVMWGTTPLPTSYNSATQLTATVGTAQLTTAGAVTVSVVSPGGTSNAVTFTVIGPVITLLSPATVTVGGPAFTLSVGGDNFVSGAVVSFGGTALTTTYVSANSLTAAVPATLIATASSINVTVANPGGATSANFGFAVGALPNITTISPTSASPGSPAFTLQVTGTNFFNGDTVQWNGVALVTTFSSATSLSAAVPATLLTASGSVNVSVLHAGGVVSNAVQFTISSATVTSISPTTAPAGSSAIQLTITGTAFVNGSTVQWNGSAIPTTYVSATQLSATVSNTLLTTVGSAFVAVQNPGGSLTTGTIFTVAGPTLTSISPTSATSGAASLTLTLTGTNFVTSSVASWNGTALPTSVASATSATATVSSTLLTTAGTFVVVMTNPGGSVTASQFFTLNAPVAPTISGVTPTSAVAGSAAFQLTVAGSGFVSGSVVQWNGTALPTSFVSSASLTALIGANLIAAAGTANITVQIPGAPVSATTAFPINPPAITTLSPTTVSAGGPTFSLTVTGGNFIPGSTVEWNGTALPTIYNSATQLTADVNASLIVSGGTASVTVQNAVGAVSAASTFTIGPFTLVITTTTLPDAIVGTDYSQVLSATGGSPPYTWTSTAGTLPTGITLDPGSGTLSGIPTAAITGTVGFTVTDSVARTVTKSIAFRAVSPLTITTTTPLTSAPAGTAFSQILAATGGTTPYTWSLAGNLPPGLALNTSTGQISGTPTVPGAYNFTINIADSRTQTASVPFSQTITVAGVTIGGITTTSTSAQQIPVNVTLANPYTVPITGTLTMVFTSAVGATDPSIQFSTGGLTTNFTIPAGTTQAVFGTQQSVLVITGTVAGSIAITAAVQAGGAIVTPATAPSITTTIAKAAPVITGVTLTASGSSLIVAVTGYSNTRDMTSGTFQFIAAAGSTLNAAPITENLAATFSAFYQSSASTNFGSQFTFSIPFSFTGSINAIGSVSVQLINSAGTSAAVTATRQ